jgi:hypothetical protein
MVTTFNSFLPHETTHPTTTTNNNNIRDNINVQVKDQVDLV